MDPSITATVLDVRGKVLPGSGDAPMSALIAQALAELRDAGLVVAFVAGSGRGTVRERVVPPLVRADGGTDGGGPVTFYVDHGASAFRLTRSGRLVPLAGYRPRTLRPREFGLLLHALAGERPWTPGFRGCERKPGQVNCMVDASWPVRRRFAVGDPRRLVVIGDSLQRGGSDLPMLQAAAGALVVQVGHAAPLPGVLHLPGGPRAAWAVLRSLARVAAESTPSPARRRPRRSGRE